MTHRQDNTLALHCHTCNELVLASVEEHAAGRPDVGRERLARLRVLQV